MKNLILSIYVILGAAMLFGQGCAPVEFSTMKPFHADGGPNPDDPKNPDNPPHCEPKCFEETYRQRKNPEVNKLDILFVTDTSGSLDVERAAVANSITSFISKLSTNLDYNIGVILAHGSTSTRAGKLYQSSRGEALVLKKSLLTVAQIQDGLKKKLTSPIPGDGNSDGGEEGLYSTAQALKPGFKDDIIHAGIFRPDAALAVIYVSDENDICARYPTGVTRVPDNDNQEGPAFIRDCEDITPTGVYAQLKTLKGDLPLIIGGVIYTNKDTMPVNGENEIGYGYKEIIELNNGVAVDMAVTGGIANGLAAIGAKTNGTIKFQTEFQLQHTGVDASTIKVYVNGNLVPHTFTAGTNSVHIELAACIPDSVIVIKYCLEDEEEDDPSL
ncbi:MAG: hypothetical protein A4S09_01055 [Proteobacteria bacterium SG_bin7]|nr:MAG: hypothetical protein A4S09_01055 [Proteobacteria bacterium SG_bin7]